MPIGIYQNSLSAWTLWCVAEWSTLYLCSELQMVSVVLIFRTSVLLRANKIETYRSSLGNQNTYNREEIIHMKHKRILLGKPQLNTPLSVLWYKWKYLRITQSFSSQAIQLLVQSLTTAHRQNRQHICLLLVLQSSYFLTQFLLGPLAATCVILTSHITLTSEITAQS